MDGPEHKVEGSCVFGFAFIFPFIFTLAFSSRGVRETDVRGCVFTFPFAFAFTFALSFALSFALGRGSNWGGEVGVIIKERGAKRAWGVRLRDSAGRRGRTFKAGAGMEPEGPCSCKACVRKL